MAGARNKPEPAAATPAAVVIEPPAAARTRESSADTATVDSMAEMCTSDWVTNSVEYDTKKNANNAAVVYRRALIRKLGGKPGKDDPVAKRVQTRVWGTGTNGAAPYVFALHLREEQAATATAS